MDRRDCIKAIGAFGVIALATPVRAHHGWSSFDQGRPIYLAGTVKVSRWQNPHAELELELSQGLAVPSDLAKRPVPAQQSQVDGPGLLARASVPTRRDRVWTIELAPLTRMQAWQVEPVKAGDRIEVVGFTFTKEEGSPVLRAEYLFVGPRAYGLRSAPTS